MKRQEDRQRTATETALCVHNLGYKTSLTLGKRYAVIPDPGAAEHGYIRIVDESGEDYLYPEPWFSIQQPSN